MPSIELDEATTAGREALEALRLMLMDEDAPAAARVSAAKTLFDRYLPKEDAELKQREAEERASALAAAQGFP